MYVAPRDLLLDVAAFSFSLSVPCFPRASHACQVCHSQNLKYTMNENVFLST